MKVKPLFDRVIIKTIQNEKQTKSGIFIPETVGDEPLLGKVEAIGEGDVFEGKKCEMKVSVGDKVLFNKYGATNIKIDNTDYVILRQSDILCIMEEI